MGVGIRPDRPCGRAALRFLSAVGEGERRAHLTEPEQCRFADLILVTLDDVVDKRSDVSSWEAVGPVRGADGKPLRKGLDRVELPLQILDLQSGDREPRRCCELPETVGFDVKYGGS